MGDLTEKRKEEHIRICLEHDVSYKKSAGFERVEVLHNALPDIDLDDIELETKFMGKRLKFPLFIEAMTGGTRLATKINKNLARAAEELGIGMGLGSQRAMLKNPELKDTYFVRDVAPSILLLGNIGATQLVEYSVDEIRETIEIVHADGLAVHLNAAQEVFQPEGNKNWKNVKERIKRVCRKLGYPVIAKETGCGISDEVAKELEKLGVHAIDVAGAGGTSWIKVEKFRGREIPEEFLEWGIPTAESLFMCRKAVKLPLIASGGIRSGLDVVKAIVLGASICGIAFPLLRPATKSWEDVKRYLERVIEEMKYAMFLLNAKNLRELKGVRFVWR